jgi:hypothetical protein
VAIPPKYFVPLCSLSFPVTRAEVPSGSALSGPGFGEQPLRGPWPCHSPAPGRAGDTGFPGRGNYCTRHCKVPAAAERGRRAARRRTKASDFLNEVEWQLGLLEKSRERDLILSFSATQTVKSAQSPPSLQRPGAEGPRLRAPPSAGSRAGPRVHPGDRGTGDMGTGATGEAAAVPTPPRPSSRRIPPPFVGLAW